MIKNAASCTRALARAKTVVRACHLFYRDIAPLGEDGIEAIPAFIEKLLSLRSRGGENGLACLCYKGFIEIPDSLGAAGQTVAIISITHRMILNLVSLMVPDMQTVVIGIHGSIQRGADGTEAIHHLQELKKRLAASRQDSAGRPQTGLQGAAGSPIMTLIGHVDAVIHAIQDRAAAPETSPANTRALLDGFVRRALEERSTMLIKTSQICGLVESLASAIYRIRPKLSSEELLKQTTTALGMQCPACGTFTPEAVWRLYLAAKGGFKPGVVGDCVVFSGKKAASVAGGRCPGCQGAALICTFDPFAIQLQQTGWQRLISIFPKKGRTDGTDQVRTQG